MPHLTGIVIAGGRRQALFSAPDERAIAMVLEGEAIDGFDVAAITADRVELRCRSETYYVSPVPDPSYRAAMLRCSPVPPRLFPCNRPRRTTTSRSAPRGRLHAIPHPGRRSYPAQAAQALRRPDAVTVRTA